MRHLRRTLLLALLVACLLPATASAQSGELEPTCSAVTKVLEPSAFAGARSAAARVLVQFRVRCNFLVEQLTFQTSRTLAGVQRHPRLDDPDPCDRLTCTQRSDTRGRCRGEVGRDVRIVGRFAVRGDPCRAARLRTRFAASGGLDCDTPGFGCPDIGFTASMTTKRPRGC